MKSYHIRIPDQVERQLKQLAKLRSKERNQPIAPRTLARELLIQGIRDGLAA